MSDDDFNIQPGPRVLAMLGEIKIEPWRCFGEIIDNSVDEFMRAKRTGSPIENPTVQVEIPKKEAVDAEFVIRDNGRGMDRESLQAAVKAGWSGAEAMEDLGLFGMGFNVATASMGNIATVWTTQKGDEDWLGLTIDLQELIRTQDFNVKAQRRPKENPDDHGTEVRVGRIRPEFTKFLRSGAARKALERDLERAYASMLRPDGYPLALTIEFHPRKLKGYRHCIWGGPSGAEERVVQTREHGAVNAYQPIDVPLSPQRICKACLNHLGKDEEACTRCGRDDQIKKVERRIHGWLGVQRYLSETDFGIDFVRMGRKIEVRNKDLFTWTHDGKEELEYPIDDPRGRGRLVGEIHLDHCRVSFTKDRFERSDPQWDEMVACVRGSSPLRPKIAKALNLPPPDSPLAKLFTAFRRNNPGGGKTSKPGYWERLLVIKDNEKALEYGQKFHEGATEHQSDERAYELIQEYEKSLLHDPSSSTSESAPVGFSATGDDDEDGQTDLPEEAQPKEAKKEPHVSESPMVTGEYTCPTTNKHWVVFGKETSSKHSKLNGAAWSLRRTTQGEWEFYYDASHRIFKSVTLMPLDALLAELAFKATDERRDHETPVDFGNVLAGLRLQYAKATELDPKELAAAAHDVLEQIARAVAKHMPAEEAEDLFDQLPERIQDEVMKKMAKQKVSNPPEAIRTGQFMFYLDGLQTQHFFETYPERFFDGFCWSDPFTSLEDIYGKDYAEPARDDLLRKYGALFTDLAWLAEADPAELKQADRAEVIRAMQALEIMASDDEELDEEEPDDE